MIHWILDVFAFAVRAPTRAGKSLSFFKNKSALQTLCRYDHQLFFPSSYRTRNMRKMRINLFFPNTQGPREISGAHLFVIQKFNYLLSYGLHATPVLRPLQNVPFCPISASDSNFKPQNTKCIRACPVKCEAYFSGVVKIFALTRGVHAPRPYGQLDSCPILLSCRIVLDLEQN